MDHSLVQSVFGDLVYEQMMYKASVTEEFAPSCGQKVVRDSQYRNPRIRKFEGPQRVEESLLGNAHEGLS